MVLNIFFNILFFKKKETKTQSVVEDGEGIQIWIGAGNLL